MEIFGQGQKPGRKNHRKGPKTQRFCHPKREAVGGKPAKTGGDGGAAAKERPKEAPFAALRPHDYRLRTWSRTPAAKPTRPTYYYDDHPFYFRKVYALWSNYLAAVNV